MSDRSWIGRVGRALVPPLVVVATIVLWEIAVHALEIKRFILPAPTAIVESLVDLLPLLGPHVLVTMTEVLLGFAVGVVGGIALAVLVVMLPALQAAIWPLVLATQTTPKVAIAPLLIIWFGVGLEPKVVIVALLAFFPVLINVVSGLESADRQQLELLRSVDASRWQEYRKIRFPAAVPFLFAGLRLALSVSVIGAIVGEWVSATEGLGYLLVYYNATLRTSDLFAVLIVLVVVASLSFVALDLIERRLSWEIRIRRQTVRGSATKRIAPAEASL